MKKHFLLLISIVWLSASSLKAQQNFQRQTPEERTAAAMEKMAPLNLDTATKAKVTIVMSDFYNAQQKAMMDMRESGNMDREALMSKRKELAGERDAKLKNLITEEQFKKWTDEIEPSLRPQRPRN